jgi:adenosylcobinamide-phosphate synthase
MGRSAGVALLAGVALDEALGDPARLHPVAGFGVAAAAAERVVYRPSRAAGAAYAAAAVALPTALAVAVQRRVGRRGPAAGGGSGSARGSGSAGGAAALAAACLAVTLGGRSLRRTALRMADLLDAGDLDGARALAPALVARRPDGLGAGELARATVESLAENTADAVAGPLVWTAVAGAPGAVAYRAANTLDAMVGYRDERYRAFGWAAARLDDAFNWPVSRLTAAATVAAAPLAGADPRGAAAAWRRDGHRHPSPNGGQVEAAFAGALGVRLGGANRYGDTIEHRPQLGDGPPPDTAAIRRAARLSACVGWLLAAALALVAGRRAWA